MIKILNYSNELPNVLHFQGKSQYIFKPIMMDIHSNTVNFEIPENLTIITCFTDYKDAKLAQQLDRLHIPYINAFLGTENETWFNYNKLYYYNQALKNVTTDYVLLLDGNDVVFQSMEGIVDKFKKTNLDILFCATKNNYPKILVDKISNRDDRGEFRYLNAGCCIGKTHMVQSFYKEAEKTIFKINNEWNSEQLIIRHVFAKCDLDKVDFDYNCSIFQTFSEASLSFLEVEVTPQKEEFDVYKVI